jgi:hypothetical protein
LKGARFQSHGTHNRDKNTCPPIPQKW